MNKLSPASRSYDPNVMVFPVVAAVAIAHFINDFLQTLLPALYPLIKDQFDLTFAQVGLLTTMSQLTGSFLQPAVGFYTDKHPKPWLLPASMIFSCIGIVMIATADSYLWLILAAAMIGLGSSAFHPEGSRMARLASGGRYGFAQSLFQVGGNAGSAFAPLIAAGIIIHRGLWSLALFVVVGLIGYLILHYVTRWLLGSNAQQMAKKSLAPSPYSRQQIIRYISILALLIFSKFVYMTCLTNYYTFYLMDKFDVSVGFSQLALFIFMGAVAVGTFFGGPLGDKYGRKLIIWVSILGVAPFTIGLPYANLWMTLVLSVIVGLILSSAFAAIVVFAQELVPGNVGLISGLFFGLMFGVSGIASVLIGNIADKTSIQTVFTACAYLPLLGIFTYFLPKLHSNAR